MKLTELLLVTCCSIIAVRSETAEANQEAFLRKASEQLDRLAPYRRVAPPEKPDLSEWKEIWKNDLDGTRSDADQAAPWEVFEFLPEGARTEPDAAKRADEEKQITIGIIADPRYAAAMQERIKRGFDAGALSLLKGIAGGVLSGVASASSGAVASASSSSSQPEHKQPTYEAPAYSYDEKQFGPWDFKKAIFSTLFQALKALGGGVLALKGQLVKGSGYLLSAKGRVVSKTGDVITSFGKQLASTVLEEKPSQGYIYDHPPIQNIEHDVGYAAGPPPSSGDYHDVPVGYNTHSGYTVPSDDNVQGGLLVVTPTKSDLDQHSDHHTKVVQEKPDLVKLEESFGGPTSPSKDPIIQNLLNSLPNGNSGPKDHEAFSQDNNNPYPPLDYTAQTYGASDDYPADHNDSPQSYGNYPVTQNDAYHPDSPGTITSSHHLSNLPDHPSVQQSVGYPPLHAQHIHYHNQNDAVSSPLLDAPKPPHDDEPSMYASLTIDAEPQITIMKVPLRTYPTAFDLPKYQSHIDFRKPSQLTGLHGFSMQGPLRISILNPMQTGYWQGPHVSAAIGALNPFRKRNALQRRALASQLARYSSSQKTRHHRL